MQDKYSVGDIIYVIPLVGLTVLALRVEEENVKKTLAGLYTTYVVSNGSRSISLEEIKGEIFRTPALCREYLMQQALASIDNLIETAVKNAGERFSQQSVQIEQIS